MRCGKNSAVQARFITDETMARFEILTSTSSVDGLELFFALLPVRVGFIDGLRFRTGLDDQRHNEQSHSLDFEPV
jgi:hypothetical protein